MADLIDRQAAIATAISGRVRTLPTTEDGEDWIRVNEVRDSLLTLPSAQPEPKTGRWIADGQKQKHGYEWMHCSVCGFSDIDVPATHTNFCPNCGARMKGEADG